MEKNRYYCMAHNNPICDPENEIQHLEDKGYAV
jgi:hypothetical protein